jgi:hypothetical protein
MYLIELENKTRKSLSNASLLSCNGASSLAALTVARTMKLILINAEAVLYFGRRQLREC